MMRLIHELKRRHVFRVAAGYAALSWLVIQIAETVLPVFGFEGMVRPVIIIMAIGLVPALGLSWVFELTPEGLKLDREVDRKSDAARRLDKRLDRMVIVILALAVGYFAFDKFVLDPARDEALRQVALDTAGSNDGTTARLGNTTLVTDFTGVHSEPTLSPDGTRMAFVSPDDEGISQIWVMSLPDGEPVQVTRSSQPSTAPSWSPKRDEILFQRVMVNEAPALLLVDALGTSEPRMVVADGRDPKFSPDGQSFVFSRRRSVWIGTLDGTEPRILDGMPRTQGFAAPMPAINAAGDVVFVMADEGPLGDLWLFESASGEFRRLTRPESDWPGIGSESPVWMPDGRTVLYAAPDGEFTNTHLWRIDTATGSTEVVSTGPGGYADPSVSSNGSRLVYSHQRPIWRLVETVPGTGSERIILESRSPIVLPVVSPDGRSVVYFGEHVYTVPVTGGRPKQRTFGTPGEATLPTWSQSDGSIWFYKGRTLHRLDPEEDLSEQVLEDFHWSRQHWLAVHGDRLAYKIRGRNPAYIEDIATGEKVELGLGIIPNQWSRDGENLLAFRENDRAIVICPAPEFQCEAIESAGLPPISYLVKWSPDQSRIFGTVYLYERPGYLEIWSISAAGETPLKGAVIGPLVAANIMFGISSENRIIWNYEDRKGVSEIWMSDDLGGLETD